MFKCEVAGRASPTEVSIRINGIVLSFRRLPEGVRCISREAERGRTTVPKSVFTEARNLALKEMEKAKSPELELPFA